MKREVKQAEDLAEAVGVVEYSEDRFSHAEKERIASACHRVLNLTEPILHASSDTTYHNH